MCRAFSLVNIIFVLYRVSEVAEIIILFFNLYKTYVRPRLEFFTAAWSPWTEADSNCIELVQKRANRMISGLTGKTYVEKLNELNFRSLEENRERADMIQTFKIIHGFSDVNPATWFRKINHNRVTRMAIDPVKLGNTKLQN